MTEATPRRSRIFSLAGWLKLAGGASQEQLEIVEPAHSHMCILRRGMLNVDIINQQHDIRHCNLRPCG